MFIAFSKKCDTLLEKLIKIVTHSEFTHCEFVTEKLMNRFLGYSSFPFEGVRGKWISFKEEEWEFIKIPDYVEFDLEFVFEETINCKYDYLGVLGFIFGNKDDKKRYFCSEWIATVLDLKNPEKLSPGELYTIVKERYKDYDR